MHRGAALAVLVAAAAGFNASAPWPMFPPVPMPANGSHGAGNVTSTSSSPGTHWNWTYPPLPGNRSNSTSTNGSNGTYPPAPWPTSPPSTEATFSLLEYGVVGKVVVAEALHGVVYDGSSPFDDYAPDMNHTLRIRGGYNCRMRFRRLDLEAEDNCKFDSVKIWNSAGDEAVLCGTHDMSMHEAFNSRGEGFWVQMVTDSTIEGTGFELEFECDEESGLAKFSIEDVGTRDAVVVVEAQSGFVSGGSVGGYATGMNHTIRFVGGYDCVLTFLEVDISCSEGDFVKVWNSAGDVSFICSPNTLERSGEGFYIQMGTDAVAEAEGGFELEFHCDAEPENATHTAGGALSLHARGIYGSVTVVETLFGVVYDGSAPSDNYAPDMNHTLRIRGGYDCRIKFHRLDLEPGMSEECEFDSVKIWNSAGDEAVLCGTHDMSMHEAFNSRGEGFWVQMVTNSAIEGTGFELEFECDEEPGPGLIEFSIEDIGARDEVVWVAAQSGIVFDGSDREEPYAPNLNHTLRFYNGYDCKIHFDYFALEGALGGECRYDAVQLWDSSGFNVSLCGDGAAPLRTQGEGFWVRLTTDNTTELAGFAFEFQCADESVPETPLADVYSMEADGKDGEVVFIEATFGTVYDGSRPAEPYSPNINRTLAFYGGFDCTLTFRRLDIERPLNELLGNCVYDYVRLWTPAVGWEDYCGQHNLSVMIPGEGFWVTMVTDDAVEHTGFEFEFSCAVEGVASETFTNETFTNETFTNETFANETFANETFTNETFTNETFTDMRGLESIGSSSKVVATLVSKENTTSTTNVTSTVEVPQPITPAPITPEPITPAPITPAPITPPPTPESATPAPTTSTTGAVSATDTETSVVSPPEPANETGAPAVDPPVLDLACSVDATCRLEGDGEATCEGGRCSCSTGYSVITVNDKELPRCYQLGAADPQATLMEVYLSVYFPDGDYATLTPELRKRWTDIFTSDPVYAGALVGPLMFRAGSIYMEAATNVPLVQLGSTADPAALQARTLSILASNGDLSAVFGKSVRASVVHETCDPQAYPGSSVIVPFPAGQCTISACAVTHDLDAVNNLCVEKTGEPAEGITLERADNDTNSGLIAGVVIGLIAVLGFIGGLAFFMSKKKKGTQKERAEDRELAEIGEIPGPGASDGAAAGRM